MCPTRGISPGGWAPGKGAVRIGSNGHIHLFSLGCKCLSKKLSIWLYKSPKAQWKRSGDDVQGPPTRRRGWGDEDTPPEAEGGAAVAWEPPRYLG